MNLGPISLTGVAALSIVCNPISTYVTSELTASPFKILNEFFVPVQINPHTQAIKKITDLTHLPNNWDGYGASDIDYNVIQNSIAFLQIIPDAIANKLKEDNIIATPYGTVVMDFVFNSDLISVEIGEKTLGFFSEFQDGSEFSINSITYNSNKLPSELVSAFSKFHKEILA